MNRDVILKHEFVQYLPAQLADATVYLSMAYRTACHKCCCGCGSEVVTPFSPTDWKLIFDGETISLEPSIGNWSFPCRSHYWIRRNKVRWARAWSDEDIETNRRRDKMAKDFHFGLNLTTTSSVGTAPETSGRPRPNRTSKKKSKRL